MIIIGAGNLGQALANYVKFEKRGFKIVGVFDINPVLKGISIRGNGIRMMSELPEFLQKEDVQIAALTVPKSSAAEIAELLVQNGIKAIWNFAHLDLNVPKMCIRDRDEIVMGIVYNPFHEEIFSAIKGKGSFLNGQPIKVSKAEKLSDTIIGLGTAKRELADENFARFRRVFGACQNVRRIGSAALELAYTACGRQDGYFEIYLNPWDYAAGMLLVQEAGGIVTDFAGNPLNPREGGSVVGTNGNIHGELLKLL